MLDVFGIQGSCSSYLEIGYTFEYLKCGDCHILSIMTITEHMARYYPKSYCEHREAG